MTNAHYRILFRILAVLIIVGLTYIATGAPK